MLTSGSIESSSTGTAPTVLYIEDNSAIVTFVERVLSTHRPGVSLVVAATGARGLVLASQCLPSLVLLDLFLPDISGDVVLRRIRTDPRTAGLRVVILTGPSTTDRRDRLRRAGADDVLTKPLGIRGLLAVVDGTGIPQVDRAPIEQGSGPIDPVRLHDLRRVYPDPESWSTFRESFIRDGHACLTRLARAADAGDKDAAARSAHSLAGLCALVGDGDVVPVVGAIQLMVRRGRVPDERQLAKLDEAFRATERALEALPDD